MNEKKSTTSVKISVEVKELLDQIHEERGIEKLELANRLFTWLYNQDKTVQGIVLGQVGEKDEAAILDMLKARSAVLAAEQAVKLSRSGSAEKSKKQVKPCGKQEFVQ